MKIHELLKEDEYDDAASMRHDPESEHASGNLDFALGDMAGREFMAIEQDPAGYYAQHGERVAPEQAQQIAQTLASVDDNTLDLMTKSKIIQRAIEANYDDASDSSHIDLASMMEVLGKVQARMAR